MSYFAAEMYTRSSFSPFIEHLPQRPVTVITGMRRVGKTTAVRYLLSSVKHTNKLYLDCERIEVRALLNRPDYESIVEELQLKGLNFSIPCIIALDEIQLVENLPSLIKYIYDTYGVKFIVTGSSSYYLKNKFSESLAGRKRIFDLYPLSFSEFLSFKEVGIRSIEKYSLKSFNKAWYEKCKTYYEEYIRFGGFPEVVLEKNAKNKKELLRDIINSYVELDVKLLSDYSVSDDLYKLAKLLAARCGNKVDFSKLSSISGISRIKLKQYVELFESTYFIYLIRPFTKNIDKEISQQPKLYFSDTGILNELAGEQISSGQLFENAIAAQLKPLRELQYYQRKTGQEIDFILEGKTAVEVKETAVHQDAAVLQQRAASIDIKATILISRYPPKTLTEFTWGGNIL